MAEMTKPKKKLVKEKFLKVLDTVQEYKEEFNIDTGPIEKLTRLLTKEESIEQSASDEKSHIRLALLLKAMRLALPTIGEITPENVVFKFGMFGEGVKTLMSGTDIPPSVQVQFANAFYSLINTPADCWGDGEFFPNLLTLLITSVEAFL